MKNLLPTWMALFIICLCQQVSLAQSPLAFPYQAVARNSGGNILSNQTISLRFSILDGSNLGPVVYQETHLTTTNALGLFTVNVGQGTVVSGSMAAVNWGSGSKFIKVEFDPAAGTSFSLMGTTQLLSVPYSLYSNVPGLPGPTGPTGATGPAGANGKTVLSGIVAPIGSLGTNGDFYINTSTNQLYGPKAAGVWPAPVSLVGPAGATGATGPAGPIGLTGPTGATGATGPAGPAGSANISGTVNNMIKFTGATTGGNSQVFDNGISVGIGTTSPNASALLHLNSADKGVLFPQVSLDSLKDVTSIPSPANGLVVFNTGISSGMQRGYYYYSTNALTWVRLADNLNDNQWQSGGTLGVQLADKADGVEILDTYTGASTNFSPKVKILKSLDSTLLNSKNNINALVLTGVNRKTTAGWENRQRTTLLFENSYQTTGGSSGTGTTAISSYTENTGTTANAQTNGLGFYVTSIPNTTTTDTPSMALFRHNVGIGAYPTDIANVTEGRLQITGFSNGDQISLRHPSNIILKWGLYVSSIDSSLNFYNNGSLRANIDRVTGVYTALSDRNVKKDIENMPSVLSNVMKLKPYNYRYADSKATDRKLNGFMAQDLMKDFSYLVYQRYDRERDKPLLTVDYSGFGVIAIKAIQEQQELIETQQSKINALENEISEIKKHLQLER